MEKSSLSYGESHDPGAVQDLSFLDPGTPFAEVHYPSDDAEQRWFIISLAGKAIGYFSTVWPEKLEIYQFFICPGARRTGVGTAAAQMIVRDLLAEHKVVSFSVVNEASYHFWCRALHGFSSAEDGDTLSITLSSEDQA
ncbi:MULTISPECIES: GNAT family N-acetyltransferase [Pseudomonas]|uniref:GNAT family N-acetyltransferase n=1 Tax=Pseudomonas rhodesiae TaxID=76760 RepID=A0A8I1JH11_9PSED|nr:MULTISPECIES: GNAT family N-acetyltransferase [Pseudomonas]MBI6605162.1 GNAT family N-acetyltransferase [Pseudomonas sp. S4_EA_1b]MBI6628172.1 GNAT family N-acetyltransferase [Pseudomonas rhodesiae]